ncbi:hypothetical protein PsYK624_156410 [Phanerochaete sordida]|uniref:Uncharacterized protein n=1 Tax=Phanerochaete sordida TaxID=48140 RepID=A0A9P3LMI4_9APHY|nr:hypothetical protein PsYK624_156410 [Phanerochaete sordida]
MRRAIQGSYSRLLSVEAGGVDAVGDGEDDCVAQVLVQGASTVQSAPLLLLQASQRRSRYPCRGARRSRHTPQFSRSDLHAVGRA